MIDWSEFFTSFIHGLIIGSIGYSVYVSMKNRIMYLEERISKFENRIKNQNNNLHNNLDNLDNTLHKHRDFFEIEISRIYEKLENQRSNYESR